MKDRKRSAVEAAIGASMAARSLWTSDFETVLGFLERVGVDPVAARARLTEMFTGTEASLCLAPANDELRTERYYALTGQSGGQPHLFVAIVVDRETYEGVQGKPPDTWQMRLSPRLDEEDGE